MIVINSVDYKTFELNGLKYARIYQPLAKGSSAIGIYNIFDTKQQLQHSSSFDEYEVDGVVYATQELTIEALLNVVYSKDIDESLLNAEDLKIRNGFLEFNDRDNLTDKLGYKIIRPDFDFTNIPEGYNNSIWEIRYEHDLLTETIVLPVGVELYFNGGFFKNGTLQGEFTRIKAELQHIFNSDIVIGGTWRVEKALPQWFGVKADGVTNDTGLLESAFNSGFANFFLPEGVYKTTSTVNITNENVQLIEGAGINATTIRLEGGADNDIISFDTDKSYLNLKNFNIGHDVAGNGHGITFSGVTSRLYCEMIRITSCFHGFNSPVVAFLQNYQNCYVDYCEVGFFISGLNLALEGSGTTIKFDSCATVNCKIGYRCGKVQEAVFIMCAVDVYTTNAIYTTDCKITSINDFHTENNSNIGAIVKVDGIFAELVKVDGLLVGATEAASVAYVVLIEQPALECKADISGITGSENVNLSPFRIEERVGGVGKFLFYNNNITSFTFTNPSTALQGGTLYDLHKGVQTTIGANGAASALTANPLGFLKVRINSVDCVIPYYNA